MKNAIKGKTDLGTVNPMLAKEWHPTKNGELNPQNVLAMSNKKVWWNCSKGHEWASVIAIRNTGCGCPYCSNQKVLAEYNDLATVNPDLAKEWHPTKNGDLTPSDVVAGSTKKAWWKCSKHEEHEWKAIISNRNKKAGCPYCSNQKLLHGFNDLATINPELSKEWHPTLNGDLTPFSLGAGSNKKVWWQCRRGHEWTAKIVSRNKGVGCKKCNAEMQTSFPEQAIYYYLQQALPVEIESRASVFGVEVDVYIPSWNIGVEYDGIYFHSLAQSNVAEEKKNKTLSKNAIHLIRIKENFDMLKNTQNLIYCVPDSRYSYLKTTLDDLVRMLSQMQGIPISLDFDIERDKIKIMEQYVENEKHNSLSVRNPELAKSWHPVKNGKLKPTQIFVSSSKKIWWQCDKGHEWSAGVDSRNKGNGCPFCANKKVLSGYNDLASINPYLAKEWHPTLNNDLTPDDVVVSSNKKAWWQCSKNENHHWDAPISGRNIGSGCPYCAGKKVLLGCNDLATINPKLAEEWHPTLNGDLTPFEVTANSNKKAWWQCSKNENHHWDAPISGRNIGSGCPYCAGKKVLLGCNDLATINPKLAKEWHPTLNGDLTPFDVTANSGKKAWWQCDKHLEHQWESKIYHRTSGSGCPYCSSRKVLVGYNDFATSCPELTKEWHPTKNAELSPFNIAAGSDKRVWWQCDRGHEWQAVVGIRRKGYSSCPECKKK